MRGGRLVAVLLTSMSGGLAAAADWSAIRPEFKVSTGPQYSYYSYAQPHNEGHNSVHIAASATGTFVVAWEDLYTYAGGYYGRANPGIWARRLDNLGRPMGAEFRVSGKNSYAKGSSSVASSPDGHFVVVWDDYFANPQDPYELGIMARRFNASGGAEGNAFQVNTTTFDEYGGTPKVALDGSGAFIIVWVTGDGHVITGRAYDDAGQPVGGEFQVNQDTSDYCCYGGFETAATYDGLNIAANAAGHFMVVWKHFTSTGSDVRGRVLDAAGTPVTSDLTISGTAEYGNIPSVVADGAGRFIVAWNQEGYYSEIHARRFDGDGVPLDPGFQATETPLEGFSYGPGVAADGAGNFIVTWDDQGLYEIFGRRFDATGTPVGGQFRVDQPSQPYYDEPGISVQKVAGSSAGDFVVAWDQYDAYINSVYGVVGRKLGLAPTPCTATPMTGCRTSVEKTGVFSMKQRANPVASTLLWKLTRGAATDANTFGDPFTKDSYAVCIYDASANAQPLLAAPVPASGACGKIPCWQFISGNRLNYFDAQRYVAGIELIRVTPGASAKSRVQVQGRGTHLTLPALPLTAPITVQVQVSTGECWSATYASHIHRNADGVFRANPDD